MKESTEHILENTNDRQVDPDGMHVVIDAERWYFLGVSHRFSGCKWGGIEICARTFEETQARLDAAASTGKITQTVAVFRDSFFGEYRARFKAWLPPEIEFPDFPIPTHFQDCGEQEEFEPEITTAVPGFDAGLVIAPEAVTNFWGMRSTGVGTIVQLPPFLQREYEMLGAAA